MSLPLRPLSIALGLVSLLALGCSCDDPGDLDASVTGDAAVGMDGSTGRDGSVRDGSVNDGSVDDGSTPIDAAGMDGSVPPTDGSAALDAGFDAAIPDGAVRLDGGGICFVASCSGTVWACGNCIDDDRDGLVDSADPDCIGACDNNERGYELMIPGSDTPNCNLDCYYDEDQGSGNDRCRWNSSCDPLEPEAPRCPFTGPGGGVSCPDPQDARCHTNCDAITPNGCDCFGCCELPASSGNFVFLGSRATAGAPACSAATATNPDSCHACTPVTDCLNTCERCEVCLGETIDDLDCDCFDPAVAPPRCRPDGGVPPDAGTPPDGGPPFDAGPFDAGSFDAGPPPPLRCEPGVQPCGLPTEPLCPSGFFCLTGCCAFFG